MTPTPPRGKSEIYAGDLVRHGSHLGRILRVDPWTYLCQVSWTHGGQSLVHRMYLEPIPPSGQRERNPDG